MNNCLIRTRQRLKNWLRPFHVLRPQVRWEHIEYFDPQWKARIQKMATYIAPGESVIDYGCGPCWLRDNLHGNAYYPVDYKRRDDATYVADFNKYEFPPITADVAFVSGALEYVEDYEWFIARLCNSVKRCILAYCVLEHYPDTIARQAKGWRNHLNKATVLSLFTKHGMTLLCEDTALTNTIFVFTITKPYEPLRRDAPLAIRGGVDAE